MRTLLFLKDNYANLMRHYSYTRHHKNYCNNVLFRSRHIHAIEIFKCSTICIQLYGLLDLKVSKIAHANHIKK